MEAAACQAHGVTHPGRIALTGASRRPNRHCGTRLAPCPGKHVRAMLERCKGPGLLAGSGLKGFGGHRPARQSPTRTSAQRPALIRPDPAPNRSRRVFGRGLRHCVPVSLPTAASARSRLSTGAVPPRKTRGICLYDPVDRVDDLEQRLPGTRLVISSGGRVLLATAPGSNGTSGTRTSAVRTPISRVSRSAAGRDHENFATNRSLMTALDECYSGSPCPHFSSSRRSPSGPIADAKSAATTRPRAADPTCGNSSPQGRAYRGE